MTRTTGYWEGLSLRIRHGGADRPLPPDEPLELIWDGAAVEVCYAPPRCEEVPDETGEGIVVAPVDPRLRDPARAGTTRAVAVVEANGWVDCNLWWVIITVIAWEGGIVVRWSHIAA